MFQMSIICFIPGNNWFCLFEVASTLLIIKDGSLICKTPQVITEGTVHKFQISWGEEWHDEYPNHLQTQKELSPE